MTKRQQAIENTRSNAFAKIARKLQVWDSGLVRSGSGDPPEVVFMREVRGIVREVERSELDIKHDKEYDE